MRRGRPKHAEVSRYPGGQIRSDPRLLEPAEFVRMREMVARQALHPAWVCELWRRAHQGMISNEMKDAGDMFIKLREQYSRLCLDSPHETPKVSQLERGIRSIRVAEGSTEREIEQQDVIEKRWIRACTELMDRHQGMAISRAVKGLCFSNEVQDHGEFLLAKHGLAVLAKHFGLTQSKANA